MRIVDGLGVTVAAARAQLRAIDVIDWPGTSPAAILARGDLSVIRVIQTSWIELRSEARVLAGNMGRDRGRAAVIIADDRYRQPLAGPDGSQRENLRHGTCLHFRSFRSSIRIVHAREPAKRGRRRGFPRSFQTSCFRAGSRHFRLAGPWGELEPALLNIHAAEMAV